MRHTADGHPFDTHSPHTPLHLRDPFFAGESYGANVSKGALEGYDAAGRGEEGLEGGNDGYQAFGITDGQDQNISLVTTVETEVTTTVTQVYQGDPRMSAPISGLANPPPFCLSVCVCVCVCERERERERERESKLWVCGGVSLRPFPLSVSVLSLSANSHISMQNGLLRPGWYSQTVQWDDKLPKVFLKRKRICLLQVCKLQISINYA
jgi:hypothetical protein